MPYTLWRVLCRRKPALRGRSRPGLISSGINLFGGTQILGLQVLNLHTRRAVQQQ
jgi:hypothetical protein